MPLPTAPEHPRPAGRRRLLLGAAAALLARPALAQPQGAPMRGAPPRGGTLYLTIDTGWGREAEGIAATLRQYRVPATLFIANEPDFRGGRTLDESWAPFWRARAAEGHAFASHTWRHWYFAEDLPDNRVRYLNRRGEGNVVLDPHGFCAELAQPIEVLRRHVPEAKVLPLWRAPGGRTTPGALRLGEACGLRHQGWTPRGFLGDELNSENHPNSKLLSRALANLRDGDVLIMHWGVRQRREPFGQVFEPLIAGLLERGFRFALLPPEGV